MYQAYAWRSLPRYVELRALHELRLPSVEPNVNIGRAHGAGGTWRIAAVVTAINALTSAGFSLAGLVTTLPSNNASAKVFAMYAAARSLPLAAAVLWLIYARSIRTLGHVAIIMAAIQACDALIGVVQHDLGKTLGPAVFALATLAAARSLFSAKPELQG